MVRIPEEYQEVEYIESTGTQYILTNYIPTITEDMKIEMDYMFVKSQGGDSFLFGLKAANRTTSFQCEKFENRAWYCGSGVWQFRNIQLNNAGVLNRRETFLIDGSNMFINDTSASYTEKRTTIATTSLYIFAGNWDGGIKFINTGARIYKLIFTANGVKEADFIPCYRKSDDEIGMYDTVSKQFYTNSGTGTFLKGHNIYYDDVNLLEIRRQMIIYKKDYLKNIEWTQDFFLNGQGFTAHSNAHYSDFIKVTPEKTFILKGYEYQTNLYDRVQGYDKEKKFQKMLYRFDWPIGKFSSTIEIPSNCFYIRISTEKSTELHMYDI